MTHINRCKEGDKIRLSMRMPDKLYGEVYNIVLKAHQQGDRTVSVSSVIRDMIAEGIEKRKN